MIPSWQYFLGHAQALPKIVLISKSPAQNGNICLGFDSTDRLDFLSHSYSPYPTDTQISTDPLIAKIGRKTDSLEELDRVENHVFISSFTHYEDSIKDFTFAGTVRDWKAYWWKEPGYQLFEAIP